MMAERRSFTRLPFEFVVAWTESNGGDVGVADTIDFGRGGLCITDERVFTPGRTLQLIFENVRYQRAPVELDAEVIWCRPSKLEPGAYETGLKIIYKNAAILPKVSEVFYAALAQARAQYCDDNVQNPGNLLTNPSWVC